MGNLWQRMIRPPSGDVTPNENDPADVPPATVGPPSARPGDPNGVIFEGEPNPSVPPPRILPSAWAGWPAEWWPPAWDGRFSALTDTAWACLDLNASVLATMPPYLVGAADSLDTGWMTNPNPDVYTSWEEFAKQLFWDYQLGEAFVLATAWYATGWPARFHVVPPWAVEVELSEDGVRTYSIGRMDVTGDMLHIRYQSSVDDARGHGPLEAGAARLVSDAILSQYATGFASAGGVPTSILTHPERLDSTQAYELKQEWMAARASGLGEPAVLSGGVEFETVQISPKDMALVELSQLTESRIAVLLGVPPFLVGLPSGGDPMTYQNATAIFDYHWRAGLRPKAQSVTAALSEWLLPRGTAIELNRDAYVAPPPLERAQVAQIYNNIRDAQGNPALTVDEIRAIERVRASGVAGVPPTEVPG